MVAVMISRAIAKKIRLLSCAFSMGFRPFGGYATGTARFCSINLGAYVQTASLRVLSMRTSAARSKAPSWPAISARVRPGARYWSK